MTEYFAITIEHPRGMIRCIESQDDPDNDGFDSGDLFKFALKSSLMGIRDRICRFPVEVAEAIVELLRDVPPCEPDGGADLTDAIYNACRALVDAWEAHDKKRDSI